MKFLESRLLCASVATDGAFLFSIPEGTPITTAPHWEWTLPAGEPFGCQTHEHERAKGFIAAWLSEDRKTLCVVSHIAGTRRTDGTVFVLREGTWARKSSSSGENIMSEYKVPSGLKIPEIEH